MAGGLLRRCSDWYNTHVHDFERLRVYRDSIRLTASVYAFTGTLPSSERWDLRRQLRRAAVSVPANIAEGAGRGDARDFARFVRIAIGSLCELQSHLEVCSEVSLGDTGRIPTLVDEIVRVRRQSHTLERSLSSGAKE